MRKQEHSKKERAERDRIEAEPRAGEREHAEEVQRVAHGGERPDRLQILVLAASDVHRAPHPPKGAEQQHREPEALQRHARRRVRCPAGSGDTCKRDATDEQRP